MSDPFLTLKQSVQMLGISMSTMRRMIAAGSGPQITHLSTRRLGIRQSHMREWLAGKPMGRFGMNSSEHQGLQQTVGSTAKSIDS